MSDAVSFGKEVLTEQEKVVSLFQYIKELNRIRQKEVKNVREYRWHLMLSDIPGDEKNIKLSYRDRVEEADAISDDVILSVHKPEFQKCPEPDKMLKEWLLQGWDDFHFPVNKKDSILVPLTAEELELIEIEEGESKPEFKNVDFYDDSERVRVFSEWLQKREAWAELERLHEKTRNLFNDLYTLYYDLKREKETIEFVSANGFLLDKSDPTIYHPLITHRGRIEFDADKNTVFVCDADSQSELYSALLQGMTDINLDAINGLMDDLNKNDYHPLDRNELPDFLKVLVHQLSSDSLYSKEGIPAEWKNSGRLLMVVQPCFIVRKRLNGTLKAIEKIIEDVSETGYVPAPIKDIVSGGTIEIPEEVEEESVVEQLASVGGESVEILLSKEANKEQLEIAKRIENYNAVLVQGPPGTGKTHTIANLMGHFLAQGKSVLVTSYTTKALEVLKEKVALGLQNLCVSMTDDSNVDMERSVDGITTYMAKTTSFEVNKKMLRIQEERKEVMAKLADVRQKLYTILNEENGCLSYNGESISPSSVSRFVAENEDTLSYIPGRVRPNTALPLTYKQLADLYRSNEIITTDIEDELGCNLPNPSEILTPADFSSICDTISEAKSKIDSLAKIIDMKVSFNESTGEVHFGNAFSVCNYSGEDVLSLLSFCEKMEDVEEWMKHAAVDGKNGGAYVRRWHQLTNQIKKTCDLGERNVAELFNNKVEYSSEKDLIKNKSVLTEIAQIFETRGRITKLAMAMHKEYEKALACVSINDHAVNSLADCQVVLHAIEYIEQKNLCGKYWDELLGNHGVPNFFTLDEKEPERIASNSIGLIETYLGWYESVFTRINALLERIGISDKNLFLISELDSELVATEKRLKISKKVIPCICDILIAVKVISQKMEQLETVKWCFKSEKRTDSDICNACFVAISELNPDKYLTAYGQLSSMYEKYDLLSKREEMLRELDAVAGDWANAIRSRIGIHGDKTVPENIEDAWKWKQFSLIAEEFLSKPFSQLQKDSLALSKEYRKLTADYAEKSGWYHLLRRTEADIDMKQALQGWKMTVKRIGKGTGKQAPALKAKARELMAKCQTAVPGWIMPINKALESLDPKKNRFDIIIIDEASQADISALAILYMGKKLIIVGDDKQVSPMAIGTEIDKITALQQMYIKDKIPNDHLFTSKTSIYDIAATTFQPLMLREHFRCVPEIIGFSNMLSYDYKIKPLRAASDSSILPAVVNFRVEKGNRAMNKTNYNEAMTIVALMKACIAQEEYKGKTFGAISLLGDDQAELIRKLIDEKIDKKEIEERRILCGNSAHFQGDERNVIFLSLVDSGTGNGPLGMQGFGPDDAYRKRYNVAVSRAQDQLWVVDSLDSANDLKPGDIRKTLIDYSLNPHADELKRKKIESKADSPFETAVASYLFLRGYHLVQQWEVGAYRLDMVAVCGKKTVAIECDGERWHSGEAKIREDMERQTILERLGWRFIRIRGSEYYKNPEAAMERVINELTALGIEPESEKVEEVDRSSDLLDRVKAKAAQILNGEEDEAPIDSVAVIEMALNPKSVTDLEAKENATIEEFKEEVMEETKEDASTDRFEVVELPRPEWMRQSESNRETSKVEENISIPARVEKTELLKKNDISDKPKTIKKVIGTSSKSLVSKVIKKEAVKKVHVPTAQKTSQNNADIIAFLQSKGVTFVDKRDKGGALWALGDESLNQIFVDAKKMGYYFHYSANGSKTTNGKPGWWTK